MHFETIENVNTSAKKKTVVIGASTKPFRYSYAAVSQLKRFDFPVVAIGLREGKIEDIEIQTGFPELKDIHTVTLYVGPRNQKAYYSYILEILHPKRIIFNPGTENAELMKLARDQEIEVLQECTLMMLSNGYY